MPPHDRAPDAGQVGGLVNGIHEIGTFSKYQFLVFDQERRYQRGSRVAARVGGQRLDGFPAIASDLVYILGEVRSVIKECVSGGGVSERKVAKVLE